MSERIEKLVMYLTCFGFIFMAWQGWRDLHNDISDIKERISALEVKVEHLEK